LIWGHKQLGMNSSTGIAFLIDCVMWWSCVYTTVSGDECDIFCNLWGLWQMSFKWKQKIRYIYSHTHIHTYIHTYMHAYIHTYIHTYIYTYIHTHTHTHTFNGDWWRDDHQICETTSDSLHNKSPNGI